MKTTDKMLEATKELWKSYNEHPFVKGIQDGSLDKDKFKYYINDMVSYLIYTRILEPCSKRSSYKAASEFLEKPSYELHDVYRALDVLGAECDLIQAEVYKNSHFNTKCISEVSI